jgi:hypothetical protein
VLAVDDFLHQIDDLYRYLTAVQDAANSGMPPPSCWAAPWPGAALALEELNSASKVRVALLPVAGCAWVRSTISTAI